VAWARKKAVALPRPEFREETPKKCVTTEGIGPCRKTDYARLTPIVQVQNKKAGMHPWSGLFQPPETRICRSFVSRRNKKRPKGHTTRVGGLSSNQPSLMHG